MSLIESLDNSMRKRPWLLSLVIAALAIYPQLVSMGWEWKMYSEHGKPLQYFAITPIRFLLFYAASLTCIILNFRKIEPKSMWSFAKWDFLVCILVVPVFYALTVLLHLKTFQFGMVYFELLILWIFVVGLSYIVMLLESQRQSERKMEALQMENLQSRYAALVNQINPHFFFNSLNGLSSLVRKKDDTATLKYIEQMSDIFRYTLQVEPMSLVTLESEVDFAGQYISILQTRYANKLDYTIDIPDSLMENRLPVLTMLPLLENISTHNIIDSEHFMHISIKGTTAGLEITNSKYPKSSPPRTSGTGLKNLSSRFEILCGKSLTITDGETSFTVLLPLIEEPDE